MDNSKCKALKTELADQPELQLVSIERFFDGNDDLGSLGCNLIEHPGVPTFRDVFTNLLRRPDVEAVYARISELDPGKDSWPFTDTIIVVGTIPADELRSAVITLEPDEIGTAEEFGVALSDAERQGLPALAVWWD
jgi:hypothetical protein